MVCLILLSACIISGVATGKVYIDSLLKRVLNLWLGR